MHGSSHGHASTGSFTLQLQGDDLISDSGCYSYVNKAEWLQPKECDSHNTMFIENSHTLVLIHGATEITNPIISANKKKFLSVFAECGWIDKDDQNLMIFKRSFIYLKAINSVIIIDSFIGQKRLKLQYL